MARKKVSYFRHNYVDWSPGLKALGFDKGIGGVGLYWILVENLYQAGGQMSWPDVDDLAARWSCAESYIREIICDYGLFEYDGDKIWNAEIVNALERQQKTSESRRNVVLKRWTANQSANAENDRKTESKRPENDRKTAEDDPKTPENVPENAKSGTNEGENVPETPKSEPIDYERIKGAWIRLCCPKLPKPRTITTQRKLKIRTRFHEFTPAVCQDYNVADPYAMFERLFEMISQSPFMAGNNDRGWTADFDWIINSPNNWIKVIEGRYLNMGKPTTKKQENNINPNSLWT